MEYLAVAGSRQEHTDRAVAEIAESLAPVSPQVVLAFHSPRHDAETVARQMADVFPGARTLGCSTMGEFGPLGMTEGGMSAIGLGSPARAAVEWIEDLSAYRFDQAGAVVRRLADQLGMQMGDLDPARHLLITLTDGLTNAEEVLVASLGDVLPGVPVVGGSAGDDLRMQVTTTFADGRGGPGSAVVVLVEPGVPFHAFAVHHFKSTDEKLVVTGASPQDRLLLELNGWPAVREYIRVSGVDRQQLQDDPNLPGAMPTHFGFRIGPTLYVRGVMRVEGEALRLGGAVEEGMVLHVARGEDDLVAATEQGIAAVLDELPTAVGMLMFNCGGRLLAARRIGRLDELWSAMSPIPAAGFNSYGEQFGPLQLNFTLTGVAFGRPAGADPAVHHGE